MKETTNSVSSRYCGCLTKKRPIAAGDSAGRGRRAIVAAGVLQVVLAQALVGAEEDVLGHVRRIPAGRRPPTERLGQAAHVMRAGAAADAEVPRAERERVLAELRDLVAV